MSSAMLVGPQLCQCIAAICLSAPFALFCGNLACQTLTWNIELMRYAYPAIFSEAPDGVTVTFPDVPEAITCGATRAEAEARAADALISALSIYVEENRLNPKPSAARGRPVVSVTAVEAIKLALHDAMVAARISNRELAARLGLDEKAARRLLDPLKRDAIGAVEAALRCLGKRVEVAVLASKYRRSECRGQ